MNGNIGLGQDNSSGDELVGSIVASRKSGVLVGGSGGGLDGRSHISLEGNSVNIISSQGSNDGRGTTSGSSRGSDGNVDGMSDSDGLLLLGNNNVVNRSNTVVVDGGVDDILGVLGRGSDGLNGLGGDGIVNGVSKLGRRSDANVGNLAVVIGSGDVRNYNRLRNNLTSRGGSGRDRDNDGLQLSDSRSRGNSSVNS